MKLSPRLAAALLPFAFIAISAQSARDPRGPGRPRLPSEQAPAEEPAAQGVPDLSLEHHA